MSIHSEEYRDELRKLERLETAEALYHDTISEKGQKEFCSDFSYLPNGFENMNASDRRFSCGNCYHVTRTPTDLLCLKKKELW